MSNERAAVLVPGARGGQSAPWMMYASIAVTEREAATHPVEWQPPENLYSQPGAVMGWVRKQVEPVMDDVADTAVTVVVGKSLGSNAAGLTAERGLPAIWLTPLLTDTQVVAALRAATVPFLLVGGTADWAWDGDLARELTPHVCEIERADHGFVRKGEPLAASAAALGSMATAIEEFLDDVVWAS